MMRAARAVRVALLFAALIPALASSAPIPCKVIGVADGDTLTCLTADKTQIKVRLAQIDAPESGQPYGQASKRTLSDLVFGKEVTIDSETTDRYGRTVATVRSGGSDINIKMVQTGMAWVYTKYARDRAYFEAEAASKAARRGLWDDPKAISPEEWRRKGVGAGAMAGGVTTAAAAMPPAAGKFTCGAKRFCTQMTSCDEARFHLTRCGLRKLDRDGDGVPCESLCR